MARSLRDDDAGCISTLVLVALVPRRRLDENSGGIFERSRMYAIEVQTEFLAAHQLRLLDGSLEPRHEHRWLVRARIESPQLDTLGTVMDFHVLEAQLRAIVAPWQGRRLNDLEPFATQMNPSAERVAEHIASVLAPQIHRPARLVCVRVTEASHCHAIFTP